MEGIGKALAKAKARQKPSAGTNTESVHSAKGGLPKPELGERKTRVEPVSQRTLRDNRLIAGIPQEPQADLYRMLRTQVLQRLEKSGGSTIGICSPNPGEGKTLTAANLAIILAMDANYTVLLVDLDLRKPAVAKRFGLTLESGLSDYLFGHTPISDCLINPGIDRLVLLPAGSAMHNSSEALTSPQMVSLAKEIKSRYPNRFVIYDLPPLLSSDDALVFLPHVDATLLVVREGVTRAGEIQRSIDLLKGSNFLGTVLNGSADEDFFPYY